MSSAASDGLGGMTDPGTLHITATLEPRGPAAALLLSDEQLAHLGGGKKTPPVQVTVNGHTFDGRVGRMGGETMIGFSKAVRAACGVEPGERIDAVVVLDEAPREVALPPALEAALTADPAARAAFDQLAPSRRKEAARLIADAKKEQTRDSRLAKLLADLTG